MGHRLSKIYTRTGDDGTTGLGDGRRVNKDDLRVEAYGAIDEVNSAVGTTLAVKGIPAEIADCLTHVQQDLFDLGGELCMPGHRALTGSYIDRLEAALDHFNESLPPLKEFILPGGSEAAANCHLARTICRRAERRLVALARNQEVSPDALRYVNRLSDLLFVLARVLARHEGGQEVLWKGSRRKSDG